jgi:hypothetical protein
VRTGVSLLTVDESGIASTLRPLAVSALALLVVTAVVQVLRPPDPYPFVIFLLSMPVVIGGLVMSHRRERLRLDALGARDKARSLPLTTRLLGVAPIALAVLADKAGVGQPVPAILLVGGFVAVALLFKRLMSDE